MLKEILYAISNKLDEVFGEEYEIYIDNVKQGFEIPCFFIQFLTSTKTNYLGKRHQRKYYFDVHFFTNKGNEEMMDKLDELKSCLEYITLSNGDMIRGLELGGEIRDNVLHLNVNYSVIMTEKNGNEDVMDSCKSLILTKGN